MLSAPMAQFSKPPPVNKLYIPNTPPPDLPPPVSKNAFSLAASRPGAGTRAHNRQMPNSNRVNRILDFSSGILKQLEKVLAIFANMRGNRPLSFFLDLLAANNLTGTAQLLDFFPGRGAEGVSTHFQFLFQFAVAQNLNSFDRTIGEAGGTQRHIIHRRAVVKRVQGVEIDRHIFNRVAGLCEGTLGQGANERHLAALESDPNRTARTGLLALATATRRFAVPAGFALSQPLAPMLGAGPGFQIM